MLWDEPTMQVASSSLRMGMWGAGNPKVRGRGSTVDSLSPFSMPPFLSPIHATFRSLSILWFGKDVKSLHLSRFIIEI